MNVIRLQLPALRERREDIPLLANYFLNQIANELNVESKQLTKATLEYLCNLPWPGNVRQLENICRWLTVMASGQEVHISDLPPELNEQEAPHQAGEPLLWQESLKQWADAQLRNGETNILGELVPEVEKIMLQSALKHTQGKKHEAAKLLGWGRNTLTRKLKELNLTE